MQKNVVFEGKIDLLKICGKTLQGVPLLVYSLAQQYLFHNFEFQSGLLNYLCQIQCAL